jgi:PAS domain S-box-containing protein
MAVGRLLLLLGGVAALAGVLGSTLLERRAIARKKTLLLTEVSRLRDELAAISSRPSEASDTGFPVGVSGELRPRPDGEIREIALVRVASTPRGRLTVRTGEAMGLPWSLDLPADALGTIPLDRALAGESGVAEGPGLWGGPGLIGYAPGPDPDTVLLAIVDEARLVEPYLLATLIGFLLALLCLVAWSLEGRHHAQARALEESATLLRNSNQSLRALIDASPLAIFDLDAEGRVVETWNAAAERMLGWTRTEVLGRRLPYVPEDQLHDFQVSLARAFGGEELLSFERVRRRKDGTPIHVSIATGPVRDPAGAIVRLICVVRDVSEIHRRELQIAFQAQLLSSVSDPVIAVDPEFRITWWNTAAERIYGWNAEEVLGREVTGVLETEFAGGGSSRYRALLARTGAFEGEATHRLRDGSRIPVEIRITRLRGPAGEFLGYVGTSRDLSRRREAARALAESEALHRRLAAAIEQSEEVAIITGPDGTIVHVNPTFTRVTGYAREEVIGRNPRLLKSGLQDAAFYRTLWETLRTGAAWRGRMRNRRKDGTLYTADVIISAVRDDGGRTVNYVAVQRDVTHEVDRDEQLRQAQKMEALGELTGGIAHDFNNLLTVILANGALLESELAPGQDAARYLRDIQTAASSGASMVRRLLAFGRRERLSRAPTDLGRLVTDLGDTLRRVLPESITVALEVSPELPAVHADPGAVGQMLLNLVTNARDAMPQGGRLVIRVCADRCDCGGRRPSDNRGARRVMVAVADSGIGMDPATLGRVFEPFFTTKPTGKGTGLGMAMVYGLMKEHGGRVDLNSKPGRGTTVTLSFPALAGAGVAAAGVPSRPRAIAGGTEQILLVEDQEPLRRAGQRTLEKLGYRVEAAESGVQALELLAAHPGRFHLVLSDMVMPGMGGVELFTEMRRRDIALPFVLATGYGESGQLNALGADAPPILQKPWDLEQLASQVRAALDETGAHGN